VSFYKSLVGLSGSALAGPAEFIAEAKAWRHRYGGMIFQQFPSALAALAGLDNELPRLPGYVAHAATVADALRRAFDGTVPWSRVHPDVPHVQRFQVWLPWPAQVLDDAGLQQAEQTKISVFGRWSEPSAPGVSMTEVTVAASALEWTADDVIAGVGGFLEYLDGS
jgi:hypothetical protein